MGFLRGSFLTVLTTLFFLAIIVQGFFLTFYFSLDYDAVKPQLSSIFSNMTNEGVQVPISEMIDEKYYFEYDCGFFDCVKKTGDPFSLMSKNAQTYFRIKSLLFLLILLVLAVLIYFLVENKHTFFLLSFILFGFSSLFFLELNFIVEIILSFLVVGEISYFLGIFSVFLSKSYLIFRLFLGVSLFSITIYIAMKFFEIEEKIYGWFKKEPAQQEIQKIVSKKKGK